MNIPESIRVGSMIYSVTQSGKTLVLGNKVCDGLIDYQMHTIDINNTIQDSQGAEQTFLHELIHAIVRERNISLNGEDQELEVEEIATGLHQVIKDNPNIFKED